MKRNLAIAAAIALAWGASSEARVTKIVIDQKVSPAFCTGTPPVCPTHGDVGEYETLTGRAFGELDPYDSQNEEITDLKKAKRNSRGKVEYVATFHIVKPINMNNSSGLMWHDVPNRGGRINISTDLRTQGDIGLSSAWQGDNAGATALPPAADIWSPTPLATIRNNEWVATPVVTGVTGKIFGRIINRSGLNAAPLNVMGNPIPYFPVSTTDNKGAVLTIRTKETINGNFTEAGTVANSDWKFCGGGTFAAPVPVTTLPVQVCLKEPGFDPTKLYQLVYTVKDPYALGVGTAAFRDLGSFFRYGKASQGNPLAGEVHWSIIRGSSQSGNFTRHFIHLGMNQDESGRIVHEGAWPLIAGRRVANNSRWGQPDGVLELYQMGSEGPQWWARYQDDVRDLPKRGILDRCKRTGTCPKVVETFGGAEVFALKMTTSWVGTDAKHDIPLPSNVRRYYLPSSTHGGGGGGFNEAIPDTGVNCPGNNWGRGTLRGNPVPATALVNRMRVALREWVMHDTSPPPSQWPTLAPLEDVVNEGHGRDDDDDDDDDDGDRKRKGYHHNSKWQPLLVKPTREAMGFPSGVPGIPNSIFLAENFIFPVFDYNWGRDYDHSEANGVPTNAPPPIRHVIKMLVPRVDRDGNEMGGVPTVLNDAPLGTYLGWNITAGPGDGTKYDGRPFHAGQVCNYVGGMVPFAKTRAQRLASGDPRPSLEERYGTHAGYVEAVKRAATNAACKGYLLVGPEAATDGSMPPQKSWHCRGAQTAPA
ncbi:MAG TPA: alpha/beta hydrolase domain-containing protein, partial [Burkholderiales bacterium]|nr:alpha/beta hydrolase domain-containing protein [Burkholderiales bacterium]